MSDPNKSQQPMSEADTASGEYLAPLEELSAKIMIVFFRNGYTLAQHFDFLAKRIGLSSPKDDKEIAKRLLFAYEKKVLYVGYVHEPMLDHVRRDPGVELVEESYGPQHLDRLSDVRHPSSNPFPEYDTANGKWEVAFRNDGYKIKKHFEKIGISFPLNKITQVPGAYFAHMNEEQRYIVLSDHMVHSVSQSFDPQWA